MYFVYAIKSKVDGRIYVGMTTNIERRVGEHNSGKTKSTKGYKPWELIYSIEVGEWKEARKKEIYLKSGFGKTFLKNLVP
ncbi:MAG: GIY-YIG nuclease family protein [Bacteroidia bacterium]|jgi:putative endonuclease